MGRGRWGGGYMFWKLFSEKFKFPNSYSDDFISPFPSQSARRCRKGDWGGVRLRQRHVRGREWKRGRGRGRGDTKMTAKMAPHGIHALLNPAFKRLRGLRKKWQGSYANQNGVSNANELNSIDRYFWLVTRSACFLSDNPSDKFLSKCPIHGILFSAEKTLSKERKLCPRRKEKK